MATNFLGEPLGGRFGRPFLADAGGGAPEEVEPLVGGDELRLVPHDVAAHDEAEEKLVPLEQSPRHILVYSKRGVVLQYSC